MLYLKGYRSRRNKRKVVSGSRVTLPVNFACKSGLSFNPLARVTLPPCKQGLNSTGWLKMSFDAPESLPIRIQQAGNTLLSDRGQCNVNRKSIEIRRPFSLEMAINIHEKGITIPKTISNCKKKMETICVSMLRSFGAKNGSPGFGMATRSLG